MKSIVLFGEASKGDYQAAYQCQNLEQLSIYLGEPPHDAARGLFIAIQVLLHDYEILFFRVHEEGFSKRDYLRGLSFLESHHLFPSITALCLPGVGNYEIFDATKCICDRHGALLLTTEQDLYDYLTFF